MRSHGTAVDADVLAGDPWRRSMARNAITSAISSTRPSRLNADMRSRPAMNSGSLASRWVSVFVAPGEPG